jgi:hypothetical protein
MVAAVAVVIMRVAGRAVVLAVAVLVVPAAVALAAVGRNADSRLKGRVGDRGGLFVAIFSCLT